MRVFYLSVWDCVQQSPPGTTHSWLDVYRWFFCRKQSVVGYCLVQGVCYLVSPPLLDVCSPCFCLLDIPDRRHRMQHRQSHDKPDGLSYRQSIMQIIKKDGGGARGAFGVFGRGLGGRVAASALQVNALKRKR